MTSFEAVDAAQSLVLDCGSHFGVLLFSNPKGWGEPNGISELWVVGLEATGAPAGWIWLCIISEHSPPRMVAYRQQTRNPDIDSL
jgi:hypothetical protein